MHDTADDAAIIRPLDPAHIRRQVRFDPLPLLIAKPKQVPGHDPNPLPKTNQDRIVRVEKLMSSDPNFHVSLTNTQTVHGAAHKTSPNRIRHIVRPQAYGHKQKQKSE